MYPAGTTLKLNLGTFLHYGIADGSGNVIHNSKKRLMVIKEPEASFAEGKAIQVSSITSENPESAVAKAERYLGMPYDLIENNCEHFARLAHGLEVESTQIQHYFIAALGAGAAIISDNAVIKAAGGAAALAALLTPGEKSPFKNAAVAVLVAAGLVALAKDHEISNK
ncbi:MAG: hypothetical protein GKR94_29605 [Gammaproteobacteria bacterium]|nr:hypothetical protein [Gammaproteobacteria bacterium]